MLALDTSGPYDDENLDRFMQGLENDGGTEELRQDPKTVIANLAFSEWKTVQRKIDSFSTFPFTIKTWTVTLSGLLLGLGKGFDFPKFFLFGIPLIPLFFWLVEKKH